MSGGGSKTTDIFTQFWSDVVGKMAGNGFGMPFANNAQTQDAAMKAMRQAFFDAWQQHCEDFMRSDAFLGAMKQSMDSALSFREQFNAFLQKAWQDSQVPTRQDTDTILQVLRGLEERVLDQMSDINRRVHSLEDKMDSHSSGENSNKPARVPPRPTDSGKGKPR